MKRKTSPILSWLLTIGFAFIAFIAVFPLLNLILASFRPSTELMRNGITLIFDPSTLTLDNFIYIFTEAGLYWTWFGNSVWISIVIVVLS
ncbi:arabinose transporter permease, partial [Halalkalibacterium halodurans]|nr:arabinose transporter permease [Halalkalibacterium halodurans]MDY7240640.1 arabinose transporter permease [Halalkalibacterium halodurans]